MKIITVDISAKSELIAGWFWNRFSFEDDNISVIFVTKITILSVVRVQSWQSKTKINRTYRIWPIKPILNWNLERISTITLPVSSTKWIKSSSLIII